MEPVVFERHLEAGFKPVGYDRLLPLMDAINIRHDSKELRLDQPGFHRDLGKNGEVVSINISDLHGGGLQVF